MAFPYGPPGRPAMPTAAAPAAPAMPPIMTGPKPAVSNPLMGGGGSKWANPLMYAGLGMLSQGWSTVPQSPFAGLASGLAMGMQANALAAEQKRQNEMLELRREEAAAKRDEREAATEAERTKREASIRRLAPIVGGPEAAADVYAAGAADKFLGPVDPWAGTKAVPGVGLMRMGAAGPEVVPGAEAAPLVKIGDERKPVGTDAPKYVLEDGSTPPIDMTPEEIAARGGRALTPSELAKRRKRAEHEEQQLIAQEEVQKAENAYAEAEAAALANPTAETRRKLEEAGLRVGLARQSWWNQGRELSGEAQKRISPPGFMGRMRERAEQSVADWWRQNFGDEEGEQNVRRAEDGTLEIDIEKPGDDARRQELYKRYGVSP